MEEPIDPAPGVVLPALLRAGRATYAQAIRHELAAAGFDDLPRNGAFLLGGMANRGGAFADLIRHLGVTKQAASQLVDTLVLRGYLSRDADPEDRRRITVELTARGRAAAAAVRAGVETVDAALRERLSAADVTALRIGLLALIDVREDLEAAAQRTSSATG